MIISYVIHIADHRLFYMIMNNLVLVFDDYIQQIYDYIYV